MRLWTNEQLVVLQAFYFRYPRAAHTDSHPDCRRLARTLRRTPSAVDSQLRNIDYDLVRGTGDRHVSQKLATVLQQYKDNLQVLYQAANTIIRRRRWTISQF